MARFSLITATRDARAPMTWLRAQQNPNVQLIIAENPGRVGLGEAYNQGLAVARGEFCCFLHDDVSVLTPGWLDKLARVVTDDAIDLVGVAGTTVLPKNGAWWGGAGGGRGSVHHVDAEGRITRLDFGEPDQPERSLSRVVSLDGVLLFGRRDHFLSQPFDVDLLDGFHLYDSDLCLRWRLWEGRELAVYHSLHVVHRQGVNLTGWQPLLDRFHQRHGGRLPLSLEASRIWDANRRALALADPRVVAQLTASRVSGKTLDFESSAQGVIHALINGTNIAIQDPALDDREKGIAPGSTVVALGAGSGDLVERLLQSPADRVLVIEPEARLAAAILQRKEWSGCIANGRLLWWLPSPEPREMREIALREAVIGLRLLQRGGRRPTYFASGSAPLSAEFFRSFEQANRFADEGSAALTPVAPSMAFDINVISPQCLIFDDLAHCLAAEGLNVRLLTVPDRPSAMTDDDRRGLVRVLRESPASVTLGRNRVWLEAADPRQSVPREAAIPGQILSWWWDVPNAASMLDQVDPESALPALAIARDMLPMLPAGSAWLPAAARSLFAQAPLEAAFAEVDFGVSFVGQSRFALTQAQLGVLAETMAYHFGRVGQELAHAINRARGMTAIHVVLLERGPELRDRVDRLKTAMPAQAYFLRYLLEMTTTASFRLAAIERLRSLPLVIFGDEGWLESGAATEKQFLGLADPTSLPAIYQRSRLNLNLSFMQVSSGVHPKVFDLAACGGAMLTDAKPELDEVFPDPAHSPPRFETLDELPDRVSDLLAHPDDARRAASASFVRERHTLAARAAQLARLLTAGS